MKCFTKVMKILQGRNHISEQYSKGAKANTQIIRAVPENKRVYIPGNSGETVISKNHNAFLHQNCIVLHIPTKYHKYEGAGQEWEQELKKRVAIFTLRRCSMSSPRHIANPS